MERLRISGLTLGYAGKSIVTDFSLNLYDGELVSLLGPSGAGKTTILKAVAGLLPVTAGEIYLNGSAVNHLPAEKRDVVLIFQKPLLFPFLNVADNIGFGLKMEKIPTREARRRITRMMELTGLAGLEARKIHELSGGQQQRVALARGLVLAPSVLLLDEPFSNLDSGLRLQMRELLKHLQQETATTMLFVTHDQSEAFSISSRICLLLDGSIRQIGDPQRLFYHPEDAEAARFLGLQNIFTGEIINATFHSRLITCPAGKINGPAVAVIRAEDVQISPRPESEAIPGIVTGKNFEGVTTRLAVRVQDHTVAVTVLRCPYAAGDRVWLHFPASRVWILPNPDHG